MLVAIHGNFTLDGLTVARYVALSAGAYALDNELAKDGPLTVGCIGRFENPNFELKAHPGSGRYRYFASYGAGIKPAADWITSFK